MKENTMDQEELKTKEHIFKEGMFGKEYRVELCTEPIEHLSFTKDFATMVQLFVSMANGLDFSRPFKMVIEYNPEQARVRRQLFAPKDVVEQYSQKVKGRMKD